jgi:two-component system, NarL family, response regulator
MEKLPKMRILIVEDHFVVRAGLTAIINSQPDMAVVAETDNGRQALELFEQCQPDVTLMDLRIPGMNGIETIAAIIRNHPRAKIIVLSSFGGDEDIFRSLQAGARAYFLKDTKGQELIKAIRDVQAGQRTIPPEIAARLAERIPRSELSPRELEILRWVARGKSNREVAQELDISEGTVRVHVSNILSKLDCGDRAQAVSEAFQRGILYLEDIKSSEMK